MDNTNLLIILLYIVCGLAFINFVFTVVWFIHSPAYPYFFKCLWKGHKPEVKNSPVESWYDVYCTDCAKPLGAYPVESTFENWMKTFPNKWKRLPDEKPEVKMNSEIGKLHMISSISSEGVVKAFCGKNQDEVDKADNFTMRNAKTTCPECIRVIINWNDFKLKI